MGSKKNPAGYTYWLGLVMLLIIISRLFYLQIIRNDFYNFQADRIRSRTIPRAAPRGIIYDRYGVILAESKLTYELAVLPHALKDQQFVLKFLRDIKINVNRLEQRLNNKDYLPFELISVKLNLEPWQIGYLEENKQALEGVIINTRIVRHYPHNNETAHVLGYVGQIGSAELARLRNEGYRIGDIIGQSGIERQYDRYLRGVDGGQSMEVNPHGKPVSGLRFFEPVPGHNVYLTIDFALQQQVAKSLGNHKGAIVVVKPSTGEVLAMVSKPDYNPNYFTRFLSAREWQELRASDHPLYNRALGAYPPGSIFKIVTLMAALESKIDTASAFNCPGHMMLGRRRFGCWRASGHGRQNLLSGFVNSCNVVFYNLGLLLTPQKIADAAAAWGLGMTTDIDLPSETAGLMPTERWKRRQHAQEWFPGDSLNLSIGQGYLLTTPLQMAMLTASVANEQSRLYKPYVVNKVVSAEGKNISQTRPEIVHALPFSRENMDLMRRLMREAVEDGTGTNAEVRGLVIRGKTGTAENNRKDHAWFVAYGPQQRADLAMAVFVEEGGFGGVEAARMAREIFVWWDKERSR